MYRSAIGLCVLILYAATLPNSLINSSSFLVAFVGFSMYSIMLSANSDSFTSSFPVWIPFISVSSWLWLGLPKLYWIKVAWVGSLVFLLILEEKLSAYHSWMLAVGLSYMAFSILRYIPSIPTLLRVLIINWCWFCQMLFLHLRWFLSFILLLWHITVIYGCWTMLASLE